MFFTGCGESTIGQCENSCEKSMRPTFNPEEFLKFAHRRRRGWEAVGNSAIALSEAARLLEIPRKCSNGNAAPIQSDTWKLGPTQLRAAGRAAYDAAQAKSQDKVLDASDKVTEACSTCHDKFRERTPRCVG